MNIIKTIKKYIFLFLLLFPEFKNLYAARKRHFKKNRIGKRKGKAKKRVLGGKRGVQALPVFKEPVFLEDNLLVNLDTFTNNIHDVQVMDFVKKSLNFKDFKKEYIQISNTEIIKRDKDLSQLDFLRNTKVQSNAIFYSSLFLDTMDDDGNIDIIDPTYLGFANNSFFLLLFLHWVNYVKYQQFMDGFLDLVTPIRNYLVEDRQHRKYYRPHFSFYYRPISLVGKVFQVTNQDQIELMMDRIMFLENYFNFYSTVIFKGMYEGEGSHYYSLCIDHHHKIIYFINPLRADGDNDIEGSNNQDDILFLETLFDEMNKINNVYKDYTLKTLAISFQAMGTACGISAGTIAYIFSLGGLKALRQFFYGFNQGLFTNFSQVTINNLNNIQNTVYVSPRRARNMYGVNFEMSLCKKMYSLLTENNKLEDLFIDFK